MWKAVVFIVIVLLLFPLLPKLRDTVVPLNKRVNNGLVSGKFQWQPVSGVAIRRRLPSGGWEQEIVGWKGPGIQIDLKDMTEVRTLVQLHVDYAYEQAPARLGFYLDICPPYYAEDGHRDAMFAGLREEDKSIVSGDTEIFFTRDARICVSSAFAGLTPNTVLALTTGKWAQATAFSQDRTRDERRQTLGLVSRGPEPLDEAELASEERGSGYLCYNVEPAGDSAVLADNTRRTVIEYKAYKQWRGLIVSLR
ncbi:MAG TPA: hypothetical protein ENN80_02365 [Candidatus Hydrogenedentes bacterium]|nr:hypothetical protein [Candidatus Hydrogenedentota bacterium]